MDDPKTPPINKIIPILKSTFPNFQCDNTPDTEGATNWLATDATATGEGIPKKIISGVNKKPPPIPTIPIITPTKPPIPKTIKEFIGCSAIGR